MYIHSVFLGNFKSIGLYPENEIIVEPRITAIIGKNESGKSNVLEWLSLIDFKKANNAAFSADVKNRIASSTGEIKYTIILKPNDADKEKGLLEEACVVITKDNAEIFGGLKDFFLSKISSCRMVSPRSFRRICLIGYRPEWRRTKSPPPDIRQRMSTYSTASSFADIAVSRWSARAAQAGTVCITTTSVRQSSAS